MINIAVEPSYFMLFCLVGIGVDNRYCPIFRLEILLRTKVNRANTVYQDQAFVLFGAALLVLEYQSQKYFRVAINVEVTYPQSPLERILFTSVHFNIKWVRNINNFIILKKPLQILNGYLVSAPIFNFSLSKIERWENLRIVNLLWLPAQVLFITELIILVIFRYELVVYGIHLFLMVKNHIRHPIQIDISK
jgi:hypothetical protein